MNRIMLADSYKYSHSTQYPFNMVSMYDYMEARKSPYDKIVFVGLQGLIREYLLAPITIAEVNQAYAFAQDHGIPFDLEGWEYIVSELHGKLPVRIKAIPEGSVVPTQVPLCIIESTDPKVPWIVGWLETLLMKVWYPTNVATKSYHVRKMLEKYGSPEWAQFAYHNFGDRGSSSVESAAIGGYAHLTQFMGTDNFNSLNYCFRNYSSSMAGYSVFATEHSTTTSYGRDGEEQFVYDQLVANPNAPIMSFVADSYDVYEFTRFCTDPNGRIRKLLESRPHQKLVLRPDSGDPIEVITQILKIMRDNQVVVAPKDQGLLKILFVDYGILWGDGITPETIEQILQHVLALGFAAENFVFGSGGDLMQNHSRDTNGFAVKCSSIGIKKMGGLDNIDVFKDPITDPGKKSKRGKVTTYKSDMTNSIGGVCLVDQIPGYCSDALIPIYENGKLLVSDSLDDIRQRSR